MKEGRGLRASTANVVPFVPRSKALADWSDLDALRFAEELVLRLDGMPLDSRLAIVITRGVAEVTRPTGEAFHAAAKAGRVVGVYQAVSHGRALTSAEVRDDLKAARADYLRRPC